MDAEKKAITFSQNISENTDVKKYLTNLMTLYKTETKGDIMQK